MIDKELIKKAEDLIRKGNIDYNSILKEPDMFLSEGYGCGAHDKIYRKALISIKVKAANDNDKDLAAEADRLLKLIDEQKQFVNIHFKSMTQKINEKDEMVFIASDETIDRDGDIITIQAWDLKNFQKNPVLLPAHNYYETPIGRDKKIWVEDNKLMFIPEFAPTEKGREYQTLYEKGFMNGWSVGFLPKQYKENDTGFIFTEVELLEISAVAVPSNPNALRAEVSNSKMIATTKMILDEVKELKGEINELKNEINRIKENKKEQDKAAEAVKTYVAEIVAQLAQSK